MPRTRKAKQELARQTMELKQQRERLAREQQRIDLRNRENEKGADTLRQQRREIENAHQEKQLSAAVTRRHHRQGLQARRAQ